MTNLEGADALQPLPFATSDVGRLDPTLDRIRARFGRDVVQCAVLLGRDRGLQVPLLPD